MIYLYNTLTKSREEFKPVKSDNIVRMYTCGMTVQDEPHIGHIRSAVTADIIRRTLMMAGYEVFSMYNFTDIDDKLIEKMKTGDDYRVIAARNIDSFMKYADMMNIMRFSVYPHATKHIQEIIELIEKLIDKGFAYVSGADVFFSVSLFKEYGKLSGKNTDDLIQGKRVEVNDLKKNPLDFVLWKGAKEAEPFWYSPFGKGRPGWHIECSAMSMKYLGETFDIHTGGEDLIFPHHENEIAQSECATGHVFANWWMHNGMMNLKGEKMSKSIGNVFKISSLLEMYTPNEIRMFLFKTHYRKSVEFSTERLDEAKSAYERIENALNGDRSSDIDADAYNSFKKELFDDINTPGALGYIFNAVSEINSGRNVEVNRATAEKMLAEMGFIVDKENAADDISDELIGMIVDIRSKAKAAKNYELADQVRDDLLKKGISINDTKEGVVWKRED